MFVEEEFLLYSKKEPLQICLKRKQLRTVKYVGVKKARCGFFNLTFFYKSCQVLKKGLRIRGMRSFIHSFIHSSILFFNSLSSIRRLSRHERRSLRVSNGHKTSSCSIIFSATSPSILELEAPPTL